MAWADRHTPVFTNATLLVSTSLREPLGIFSCFLQWLLIDLSSASWQFGAWQIDFGQIVMEQRVKMRLEGDAGMQKAWTSQSFDARIKALHLNGAHYWLLHIQLASLQITPRGCFIYATSEAFNWAPTDVNTALDGNTYPRWKKSCFYSW